MTVHRNRPIWFLFLAAACLTALPVFAQVAEEPGGLQVTDVATDPGTEPPLACISFNERLAIGDQVDPASFVLVEPVTDIAITARRNFLCLEGLKHGDRYHVILASGPYRRNQHPRPGRAARHRHA